MIKLEGLDSCIIGVCCRCGEPDVLLYSTERVIHLLMSRDRMSWSEAEQFYCVNIAGAWMGAGTPAFMDTFVDEVYDCDVFDN